MGQGYICVLLDWEHETDRYLGIQRDGRDDAGIIHFDEITIESAEQASHGCFQISNLDGHAQEYNHQDRVDNQGRSSGDIPIGESGPFTPG